MLINHTTAFVNNKLFIVCGGGNCFSFGTHFNHPHVVLHLAECKDAQQEEDQEEHEDQADLGKSEKEAGVAIPVAKIVVKCDKPTTAPTTAAQSLPPLLSSASSSSSSAAAAASLSVSTTTAAAAQQNAVRVLDAGSTALEYFTQTVYPERKPVVFRGLRKRRK